MLNWLKGKKTILVQVTAGGIAGTLYLTGILTFGKLLMVLWAAFTIAYFAMKINRMIKGVG